MLSFSVDLCERYRRRDAAKAKELVGVPHFALSQNPQEVAIVRCHEIVKNVKSCVMSYGEVPTSTQSTFLDMMMRALIPFIYIRYWDLWRKDVLRYHGIEACDELVVISTPRQFGKTTAVCMFVAACLYHVPGYVAYTFSVAQRQATALGQITLKYLHQIPGAQRMVMKSNNEEIMLSRCGRTDDPDNSTLFTMPGRADKCRGFRPVQVLLEEAGFVDQELFYGTIVPTLGVVGRSCIAISSPPKDGFSNFFSKLFECKTPSGKVVFAQVRLEAMCKACKEEKADTCPHSAHIRPSWKDEYRDQLQRAIFSGNMEWYRREVLGITETPDLACYDTPSVVSAFSKPPYRFTQIPLHVYLVIDPSGGGTGSDTSWVFLAHSPTGDLVIIGSNTVSMKRVHPSKEVEMLRADVEQLRSMREFQYSTLYIIVEANHCNLRAQQIAQPLEVYGPCVIYSQDPLQRMGIWVTADDKERFVQQLASAFLRHRVITYADYVGDINTKHTLMQQACDYRRVLKPGRYRETNRVIYTGKGVGKDDIIMSLMIGNYYAEVIRHECR